MKKIIFAVIIAFAALEVSAQEQGKFRVGLNLGYTIVSGGGGVLVNLEPKYNLTDNSNVGLRLGSAVFGRVQESADGETFDAEIGGNGSYLATYDYYFNNGSSKFAPYVGAGAGIFGLAAVSFNETNADEAAAETKFGGMFRAGFEIGKFRIGGEYNLVPKSDVEGGGSIKNSYMGISIGFFVGGGKWGSGGE